MTNFEKYAREGGCADLAQRLRDEGRMASALVKELLIRGALVSVNDGEAWVVVRSSSYRKVMDALYTTDSDTVVARDVDKALLGRFYLVYGNSGAELVADYTDNDFCNSVWEALSSVRDRMEV